MVAGANRNDAYGKCLKISYTKSLGKMAYTNSAHSDQTAPGSGPTLFSVLLSILRSKYIKIKIQATKVWNMLFEI